MKKIHEYLHSLGIEFKDDKYYVQALTHPSYENEVDKLHGNYQRLEFLGDAVLELVVSRHIYFNFKDMDEGNMTLLRANLVNEYPLADMAKKINLGDYILLGQGEIKAHGNDRTSLLCDVFESLIAAIYLDLGQDEAEKFITRNVQSYINEKGLDFLLQTMKDPKTRLQELVQSESRKAIRWVTVQEGGTANDPIFKSKVYMDDVLLGEGTDRSTKKAEKQAAEDALRKMVK